jgi:hypothetical protein
MPDRLRGDDRGGRGHQHRQGDAGRQGDRTRSGRHRAERDPGGADGGGRQDRRRRHQPRHGAVGQAVRDDSCRQPEGGGGRHRRPSGRADRRRR